MTREREQRTIAFDQWPAERCVGAASDRKTRKRRISTETSVRSAEAPAPAASRLIARADLARRFRFGMGDAHAQVREQLLFACPGATR